MKYTRKNAKNKRRNERTYNNNSRGTRVMNKRKNKTIKKYIFSGGNITKSKTKLSPLLKNPESRYANVLNVICGPNTRGECVDFGSYRSAINRYFENFNIKKNKDNIKNFKKIGQASANGMIFELKFTKNNYTSYAVLKTESALSQDISDALFYEYYIGKYFINKYLNIFPCFVETYGAYELIHDDVKQWVAGLTSYAKLNYYDVKFGKSFGNVTLERLEIPNYGQLATQIEEIKYDNIDAKSVAEETCKYGSQHNFAILLQHYDNLTPISNIIDNEPDISVKIQNLNEIYQLLFQVYFCLHCMKKKFTHYDLHKSNALAYKPYVGKNYVVMNYHTNDGKIITFPTEYIMKIIDYGRCYFNDSGARVKNTKKIAEQLCIDSTMSRSEKMKKPCYYSNDNGTKQYYCGEPYGTNSILGEYKFVPQSNKLVKIPNSWNHTCPPDNNVSHDLRLLNSLKNYLLISRNESSSSIAMDVNTNIKYEHTFGTPALRSVKYDGISHTDIKNVTEAFIYLS